MWFYIRWLVSLLAIRSMPDPGDTCPRQSCIKRLKFFSGIGIGLKGQMSLDGHLSPGFYSDLMPARCRALFRPERVMPRIMAAAPLFPLVRLSASLIKKIGACFNVGRDSISENGLAGAG